MSADNGESEARTKENHEGHYHDPLTWPWIWLFELYVFADKYDTRDFRMSLFVTIQAKFQVQKPQQYDSPNRWDMSFIAHKLYPSSPLFQLLADIFSCLMPVGTEDHSKQQQAVMFGQLLPADFLAACFIACKRRLSAICCVQCREPKTPCDSHEHTASDFQAPQDLDVCFYHEHMDEEEAERCVRVWDSFKSRFADDETS